MKGLCRNQCADLWGSMMGGAEPRAGRCVASWLRPSWELRPNGSAGKGFWGGLGFSISCQELCNVLNLPPEGGVIQYNSDLKPFELSHILWTLPGRFSCVPHWLAGRRWGTDNCLLPTTHLFFIYLSLNNPYTISQECFTWLISSSPRPFLIVNEAACDCERWGLMLFCFRVISRAGANGTFLNKQEQGWR